MEAWQERVIAEHDELGDKLLKLSAFIAENPQFQSLDAEDQRLMREQLDSMRTYHTTLEDRILRFKAP
jgi:hypothetical protein